MPVRNRCALPATARSTGCVDRSGCRHRRAALFAAPPHGDCTCNTVYEIFKVRERLYKTALISNDRFSRFKGRSIEIFFHKFSDSLQAATDTICYRIYPYTFCFGNFSGADTQSKASVDASALLIGQTSHRRMELFQRCPSLVKLIRCTRDKRSIIFNTVLHIQRVISAIPLHLPRICPFITLSLH